MIDDIITIFLLFCISLVFTLPSIAQGPSLPTEVQEEIEVGEILKIPIGKGEVYGMASYYGKRWDGRRTANMEIYDSSKLTAASPTLPFNTKIRVTNLDNNKSIVIRINDRGPYKMQKNGRVIRPLIPHPKRVLDLSRASFEAIGSIDKGLLRVKYEVLD